jgi:flagellar FliL protein
MAENKSDDKSEEKGGGKLKLILMILGGVLLLVGVGVGAYFLGAGGAAKQSTAETSPTQAKPAESGVAPVGPMLSLDDFIVNILDAEGTRYLKVSMTLELLTPEGIKEIEERKAQVRDTILLYLGSKSFDEIRDLQGKLQLRADLIGKLNALLTKGKIKTIYFTDFVVQ